MRPVDIKTINYRGNKASKRRPRFKTKTVLMIAGGIVLLGGLSYALFFAPWFQVNAITFHGVSELHQAEVRPAIDSVLGQKKLGLPIGRSIVFLKSAALKASLAEQFPFLEQISVTKNYFHTLEITGTEREAEGVWCFNASTSSPRCQYFDHSGVLWGQAIQSSGVLFLNIDDMRIASGSSTILDPGFLQGIQTVVSGLREKHVQVKKIVLPADSFTEFDAITSEGYPLKFSLDSDLPGQLKAYQIFRSQKLSNGEPRPEYLDLRFDGRVYFK